MYIGKNVFSENTQPLMNSVLPGAAAMISNIGQQVCSITLTIIDFFLTRYSFIAILQRHETVTIVFQLKGRIDFNIHTPPADVGRTSNACHDNLVMGPHASSSVCFTVKIC